jgi:hypothetical protein
MPHLKPEERTLVGHGVIDAVHFRRMFPSNADQRALEAAGLVMHVLPSGKAEYTVSEYEEAVKKLPAMTREEYRAKFGRGFAKRPE